MLGFLNPPNVYARRAASTACDAIPSTTNNVVTIDCHSITHDGRGIGRLPSNKVVFVPRMLPGERATVQVTAEKAGYAEAQKIDQVHPPTGAVQAPCPHMDACGGCQLQQVSYKTQLQLKHKLVVDTLQRIGKFDLHHVPHVLGSPAQQWEYRNNMQFAWDAAGQRLGLRPPGGHAEVVHIDRCLLQSDTANMLLEACRALLVDNPVLGRVVQRVAIRSAVDTAGMRSAVDTAGMRSAVDTAGMRSAVDTAGTQADVHPDHHQQQQHDDRQQHHHLQQQHYIVNFEVVESFSSHTSTQHAFHMAASTLRDMFPNTLRGVVYTTTTRTAINNMPHNTNSSSSPSPSKQRARRQKQPYATAQRESEHTLSDRSTPPTHATTTHVVWGTDTLREARVGPVELQVSVNSFFQVNPMQAAVLFDTVRHAAALQPTDTLLDLFCGTGAIGLSLAASVARVVGIDVDAGAVANARHSAELNNVPNASFFVGDLTETAAVLQNQLPAVDVVVLDPARAGLSNALVQWLCTSPLLSNTRCLVYVSCNVSTQARDLARLCQQGPYKLVSVQPVDMFAQTVHVETVACLERKVL